MTRGIDFTYTYPTGNNGRISQMADNITGEQVSYTYDQLNRLVQSASSVTGTMPFAYDGFGNLTQQGQTSLSVDPNTNRINSAGYQYNANGNVTQAPGPVSYSYDVANRLVSNGAIYNPRNQRVFDGAYIYLYTPDGKQAGKYQPAWGQNGSQAWIQGQPNVYFAGKLIQEQGQWVMTDRLGSVRLRASGERSSYQPYGAEVAPTTSDQRTKFATYFRDSAGMDYAGQRYYSNVTGRFLTPDPADASAADPTNPNSWNMYAYAGGDPVNFIDPDGLAPCSSSGFVYNGMMIGTVAYALALTKDVTALAETEYTEAGHGFGTNSTAEEDMIGEVVMNRWALVNGYSYLYPTARRPPQDVSIWGTPGGIANIVQAKGQFDVWDGSSLKDSARANLDHALNSDFSSKECNDLAWAVGSAIAFISSPTVNLYYDAKTNLAPLAFNSGNLAVPPYMQKIGSFGDANVFYGAPVSEFSANLIPLPRPRPIRPPTPPGRPGRPRGGPIQVQ